MSVAMSNQYMGQVGVTDTTLYTCPSGTKARILKCTVTNDTTVSESISFHKVESGGSVGDDKLILNSKVIGSEETYECPEVVGQVLNAGGKISAIASAASQLTCSLDLVEIT